MVYKSLEHKTDDVAYLREMKYDIELHRLRTYPITLFVRHIYDVSHKNIKIPFSRPSLRFLRIKQLRLEELW